MKLKSNERYEFTKFGLSPLNKPKVRKHAMPDRKAGREVPARHGAPVGRAIEKWTPSGWHTEGILDADGHIWE